MSLHFILDGYNLIKQDDVWSGLKLQAGREQLIKAILKHCPQGSSRNVVTIVFDGQRSDQLVLEQDGIRILFSSDESADEVIKRLVEEATNPKCVVVVTDDRQIRYFVAALGAQVKWTKEFWNPKARPLKGPRAGEAKPISYTTENTITNELSKIWLKKK